jgi:predicted nucleic acid-binding Zn ribbon protein
MNNWNDDKLVKVSTLLQKVIYQKKWQKRLEIHNVFNFWTNVVGSEVAMHAQPHVIHGNTLWVEVSDSVWMQHLQFMKYELLKKVNEQLYPEVLDDIRFRMGYGQFREISKATMPELVKPDAEKKEEFDRLVECLDNNDSRQALKKLWLAFASHKTKP